MTEKQIHEFEKNQTQMQSLHSELSALTKKSATDSLSKFKLQFVNKIIAEANMILSKKYRPFEKFDQFDEDEIPSNSDVTMILGQYLNCLEKLRADNIQNSAGWWYWVSDKGETELRTSPPKKIENEK
jgi:hypothetical protein